MSGDTVGTMLPASKGEVGCEDEIDWSMVMDVGGDTGKDEAEVERLGTNWEEAIVKYLFFSTFFVHVNDFFFFCGFGS